VTPLCFLPGCDVDRVIRRDPHQLVIVAHHRRDHGRCPGCGTISSAVHSRYEHHPTDLPSFGQAVRLRLQVRRFYCHHLACRRRTFAEPLQTLLPPRARRTRRLARVQGRIGLALGGEAGARLLPHLAMTTRADPLLRLVRRLPLPPPKEPRVLGVDDWAALRKQRTYGTILVDLERRRVVDLLPDWTATTLALADWLRRRRAGAPALSQVSRLA
jgi:transposase